MAAPTPEVAKGPFVSELRPGERIIGFFYVRQKQLEPFRDRTRGEYLTLTLSDRTGQVIGRVWENAPALAETFEVGSVIKVAADVEEYSNRLQLIIHRLRVAEEGEYDLADYLPVTERDVEAMLAFVRDRIESITEPHLAQLLRRFYDDETFSAQLRRAPAARRVHHAYLGGTLEHLYEMLRLAETVTELYPALNRDLLEAGILLRAPGLLREYAWTRDIEYTDAGRLLGHIVLGDEQVARAIAALPDFPEELALRVRHMLVSHRGRYEWGSPRVPQTVEAIAFHHLENLSAQINRFQQLLATQRDPGQPWTSFNRLLGRPLFAGYDGEWEESESSSNGEA